MTKSGAKPISSTRRKPQHSSPVVESDILQQLQAMELLISKLADRQPVAGYSDGSQQFDDIQQTLECQTELLHVLANGTRQFQQQVVAEVVKAIENAGLASNGPLDHVANESQVEKHAKHDNSESQTVGTKPQACAVESSWATIREAMLKSSNDESHCVPSGRLINQAESIGEEEALVESDQSSTALEPLDFTIPEPFDSNTIHDQSLRAEFQSREEIMRLMSVRLRQNVQPLPMIPTEQLREIAEVLPNDLRQRIERSIGQLDEQLRLTELELSLERAKIAREITRLEANRNTVESMARQMGYRIKDDGILETTDDSDDSRRSGRRWLRVLGFGR